MKGKWSKCYLMIGTIIILIVAAIGSYAFVKSNFVQADSKHSFESIYINTDIDFIIPSPADTQIAELESMGVGIDTVTPYYETNTKVDINGSSCQGIAIMIPDANKIENTPYTTRRVINGKNATAGEAIMDQLYAEKNGCNIGDQAKININGTVMTFVIVGVSEPNSYCNEGSIALVLTAEDANILASAGIKYSAAYVKASDYNECKNYLLSEYKPYGRLKEQSEFNSDDSYNQHVQNFEDADWTKEITDCNANYDSLKIKYENVDTAMYRNLAIYAVIVALAIIVLNIVFMNAADVQKAMKIFIVKKGGTVADSKKFYSKGIWFNFVEFIIGAGAFYYVISTQSASGIVGIQLINLCIPVGAALVASLLMSAITRVFAGKKYNLKKVEIAAIKKELGIPIDKSEQ